jgi:hypothetical protein
MKTTRRTEAQLEESIVSIFADCPELCGFTVARDGLVLSDVGVYPTGRPEELKRICEEIRAALVEVMDERPDAKALLAGRTFARALH